LQIHTTLPAEIQEALGDLVGAAREGLLALSVGVGLRVVHELMEAEVDEVVGPKGKWNQDRSAKRHGHEDGSMTLGGRRVPVSRPRIHPADGERELPVAFIEKTRTALEELMARRLDDTRLAVMMLDGLEIAGRLRSEHALGLIDKIVSAGRQTFARP
jgi:hypothetical protein